MKKLLLLLLLLLLPCEVWGTTYYVSSSGADTNNGTTTSTTWAHHPWDGNATDTAAGTALSSDDQVLYKRGETFSDVMLSPNESGTSGHPIITGAYGTGAIPILDASNSNNNVIYVFGRPGVNNVNYLTFQDLYLKNPTQVYGSFNASGGMTGLTLQRCTIESATTTNYGAAYISGNSYGDPEDVLIDSNTFILKAPGTSAAGLYVLAVDTSSNYIISNNTFQSKDETAVIEGIGIYLSGSNSITMTGNTIADSTARFYYGIRLSNSDDNLVEDNDIEWVWDGDDYPAGLGYGIYIEGSSESNLIRANYLYKCNKGIFLNSSSGTGDNEVSFNIVNSNAVNGIDHQDSSNSAYAKIYNNTVYVNPTNDVGHGIAVQVDGVKADIQNNVVYNANSAAGPHCIFISGGYDVILGHNVYYASGSAYIGGDDSGNYTTLALFQTSISDDAGVTSKEANSLNIDPQFVDADNGNFTPQNSQLWGGAGYDWVAGNGYGDLFAFRWVNDEYVLRQVYDSGDDELINEWRNGPWIGAYVSSPSGQQQFFKLIIND